MKYAFLLAAILFSNSLFAQKNEVNIDSIGKAKKWLSWKKINDSIFYFESDALADSKPDKNKKSVNSSTYALVDISIEAPGMYLGPKKSNFCGIFNANTRNETLKKCKLLSVIDSSNAIIAVVDGICNLYNFNGKKILERSIGIDTVPIHDINNSNRLNVTIADDVSSVSRSILKIRQNGKYGLINTEGEILLPCDYSDIYYKKGRITAIPKIEYYNLKDSRIEIYK